MASTPALFLALLEPGSTLAFAEPFAWENFGAREAGEAVFPARKILGFEEKVQELVAFGRIVGVGKPVELAAGLGEGDD
jgi:hypothetical protein